MKSPTLLHVLISLTGILATVLVCWEVQFEQDSIKTSILSHRLLKRGVRTIDGETDEHGVSSNPDRAYTLLNSLIDEYKRRHSQDQLMRELKQCRERNRQMKDPNQSDTMIYPLCNDLENRKFLVSYYSCPEFAGNRLHHFMNGMIWAIVTGRTLVYDIFDQDTCHRLHAATRKGRSLSCDKYGRATEAQKECNQATEFADWIPSFRVWRQLLRLEEPTHAYCGLARGGKAAFRDDIKVDILPDRVISSCHGVLQTAGAALLSIRQFLGISTSEDFPLIKPSSIENARILTAVDIINLNKQGGYNQAWNLYGVLLNEAFAIRPHLLPDPADIISGSDVVSIGIHSRHVIKEHDGSDIEEEKACLRMLLKTIKKKKRIDKCAVYIMSDRMATVEGLMRESKYLGCEAIKVQHFTSTPSRTLNQGIIAEHGPFDKVDFFRDLALVSNAEDALIGPFLSSSTFLLREMMEYNRKKKGISEKLETCFLHRSN